MRLARLVLSFGSLHWSFAQEPTFSSQEKEGRLSVTNEDDRAVGADDSVPESEGEKAGRSRPVVRRFGAKP